jgi:hypothetical protein
VVKEGWVGKKRSRESGDGSSGTDQRREKT